MVITAKKIETIRHQLINSVSGDWKILSRPGNKYNIHYEEVLLAEEITGKELYYVCAALRKFHMLMSREKDIKLIWTDINNIKKGLGTAI